MTKRLDWDKARRYRPTEPAPLEQRPPSAGQARYAAARLARLKREAAKRREAKGKDV